MKRSLVLCLLLSATPAAAQFGLNPQVPLAPAGIPQFVEALPVPDVVFGNQPLTIRMCEFESKVLPFGSILPGEQPRTTVWGYIAGPACPAPGTLRETYLGPVIINVRNAGPTSITYVNELPTAGTTGVLAYKFSTDQTLHWADPLNNHANACMPHHAMHGMPRPAYCDDNYDGPIPAVPHLHGGEVPPEIDGGPDAWVTSDGLYQGHGYYSAAGGPANGMIYNYPNTQEASPAWFHDHTLGATRLNVYAGLAGGYVIADPGAAPANLPPLTPLIVQDRSFDTDGELFFTAGLNGGILHALNPEHPYWNPEFVGDVIVVNGRAWPKLDVEAKRQRFLILNGSNARGYDLWLANAPPAGRAPRARGRAAPRMWVVGNDGGYLDAPVEIGANQKLRVLPGERYEVIVDFGGLPAGTRVLMLNSAATPYPAGAPVDPATTGRILAFDVVGCATCPDASWNPAAGAPLRAPMVRLTNAATGTLSPGVTPTVTRQLTLNEVMGMPMNAVNPIDNQLTAYPGGPLEILVNNTLWSGESDRPFADFQPLTVGGVTTYYSELPEEGTTEVWEIINITADAHPIHLHLVQFQVLNRQTFNAAGWTAAYDAAFPGSMGCAPGVYCPGFGPPADYNVVNADGAVGGNPAIGPFLRGRERPPLPEESGWKDTVVAFPGEVTRIAVRWAPTDLPVATPAAQLYYPFDPSGGGDNAYVWHCHIIDHEDNEMMRPDFVIPNPSAPAANARPLQQGRDY